MKGMWYEHSGAGIGCRAGGAGRPSSAVRGQRRRCKGCMCRHPALRAMERRAAGAERTGRGRGDARRRRDQRCWRAGRDDVLWRCWATPRSPQRAGACAGPGSWRARARPSCWVAPAQGAALHGPLARLARILQGRPRAGGDLLDDLGGTRCRRAAGALCARAFAGRLAAVFAPRRADAGLRDCARVERTGRRLPDAGPAVAARGAAGRGGGGAGHGGTAVLAVWFQADRAGAWPMLAARADAGRTLPCGYAKLTLLRVGYDTYAALERQRGRRCRGRVDAAVAGRALGQSAPPAPAFRPATARWRELRCADGHCRAMRGGAPYRPALRRAVRRARGCCRRAAARMNAGTCRRLLRVAACRPQDRAGHACRLPATWR